MRDKALTELFNAVYAALGAYSNVHRGSGHFSLISTALYEEARQIIKKYSRLNKDQYETVFCTASGLKALLKKVKSRNFRLVSSKDLGLPLGVSALVIKKRDLPRGAPPWTGGGVVKLVSRNSVVWSSAPERYEAGTPAVINIIAFARALQLTEKYGRSVFRSGYKTDFSVKDLLYIDEFAGLQGKELLLRLRNSVKGKDTVVPAGKGDLVYANLDNAASTPALKPVWDVFRTALSIADSHRSELMAETRKICRDFLKAPKEFYDIFFTANTTDSLNIAAGNLCLNTNSDTETVVLNTTLEHHSNELVWRCCRHVTLERLAVDSGGFLDMGLLGKTLKAYNEQNLYNQKRIRLVSICGISNVLGTVHNLKDISAICHRYDAKLLVDAAQLAAHRKTDMLGDGIDILALSGHKMYAPFGAGVLVTRKGLLENGVRTVLQKDETDNAAGIAALGKAMNLLQRVGMDAVAEEERELTGKLVKGLAENRGIEIYGVTDTAGSRFRNRAGIVVFELQRVPHNLVVKELAEKGGIGVRDGCFCAHIIVKDLLHIHPLREKLAEWLLYLLPGLSHPANLLPGLVRVSLGIENDEKEVQRFLDVLQDIARTPRTWIDRFIAAKHNGTPFMKRTDTQKKMEAFVCSYVNKVFASPEGD